MLIISLLASKLLMGSNSFESLIGAELCSMTYWIIFITFIVIALALVFLAYFIARHEYLRKVESGYEFQEGDIQWKPLNSMLVICFVSIGGLAAAIVGVGGGIIFSPLLVSFGLHPNVAISTGLYLSMYLTLSTTAMYVIQNRVNLFFALWLGFWIILGTTLGVVVLSKLVQKSGRASLLVYLLVIVLIIAALCIIYTDVTSFVSMAKAGENLWAISSICSTS